jgi:hypothetical protein
MIVSGYCVEPSQVGTGDEDIIDMLPS